MSIFPYINFQRVVDGYGIFKWWLKYSPEDPGGGEYQDIDDSEIGSTLTFSSIFIFNFQNVLFDVCDGRYLNVFIMLCVILVLSLLYTGVSLQIISWYLYWHSQLFFDQLTLRLFTYRFSATSVGQ